jgi:hypothetical protein
MSYGRRGVNVSQYLRDLNVAEQVQEETIITDDDLAKDLALFTNTQFYDFETGQNTDYQAPAKKAKISANRSSAEDVTPTDSIMGGFATGLDFIPG